MREAAVGLPQEEQSPGSGEQAVLHSRQEDGQGLWHRENEVLLHDQVSHTPPLLSPHQHRRQWRHL